MTTIECRPANLDDHEWIVATIEDSYSQYVEDIGKRPAPMLEDYKQRIGDGLVTVAVHTGVRVGLVVMWPIDDVLYIDSIAVPMAGQGLGVGSAILSHVEDRVHADGLLGIRLYTNELMTANLSWYPRRGFTETHRAVEDGYARVYFEKLVSG